MNLRFRRKYSLRSFILSQVNVGFLATLILFATESGLAGGANGYQKERFFLSASENYFSSTENFGESGKATSLGANKSFSIHEISLRGRYDFSKEFSFFSQMDMGFAESKSTENRSSFNISNIWLGADYLLYSGFVEIIPELKASYPLNKFDTSTDEVLVGEGAINLQAGSFFVGSLFGSKLTGYLGALLRDGGRSHLLPWSFEVHLPFGRLFTNVQVKGFFPITDDEFFDNKTKRYNLVNKVSAGSLRYYSINSSSTEIGLSLGYKITKDTQVALGYSTTTSGERSAKGSTLSAQFEMAFGDTPARAQSRKELMKILEKETAPSEESPAQKVEEPPAEEVLKEEDETTPGKFVPDTPTLQEPASSEAAPKPKPKSKPKPEPKQKTNNKFKQSR